ncbi:hypothetical protein [uncultured Alistipes sp.]|uniref:hypothetical protein n=1 Tax=uncultured Alistipes sp. TaxID=538949 RepID=UPI00272CAA63|nr:hypothetical protein [uncultured Alistipes sp.]
MNNVGIEGDCWSSSSYASGNNNAGRIYFNAGNVNPVNGWYRSIGFSVRCVQASAREVVFAGRKRSPQTGGRSNRRKKMLLSRNTRGCRFYLISDRSRRDTQNLQNLVHNGLKPPMETAARATPRAAKQQRVFCGEA